MIIAQSENSCNGERNEKMGNCDSCGGSCGKCVGCEERGLTLTVEEIQFLRELGLYAFMPVARKADDMIPVFLEFGEKETMSLVIQCLEKKLLIDIDYTPLPGANMGAYKGYPVHGSIALTQRGQQVLELLDVLGITE